MNKSEVFAGIALAFILLFFYSCEQSIKKQYEQKVKQYWEIAQSKDTIDSYGSFFSDVGMELRSHNYISASYVDP